ELRGCPEAAEVADLRNKCERGQGVDAAQATQPGNQLAPRALLGCVADRSLELLDPRVDEIDCVDVGIERLLLSRKLEALLAEPLTSRHRPRGRRQPTTVAQTELRKPLPVAHPIQARVLARAHQVTRCLQLRRGNMDRLEQPAGKQTRELPRVTWIGLDPVARPLR